MNRVVFASLTILCLLSVSSIMGLIQIVKADGEPIYIQADGSISPPNAPIFSADNITYTLTGNITANADGIVIERDNIVLNGAGYTVTGSIGGNGTTLTNRINVKVRNMKIENFTDGICLVGSSNNTLSGNTVTNNLNSIVLLSSSDRNTLSGNNVTANSYIGIWLYSSSDSTLSGNNVMANSERGIELYSSSNNTIYHNDFINNTSQVYSSNSTTVWDNGYPSGGNYWSDYNGTDVQNGSYQNETGSDGIGDTPYLIDANNTDYFPLMGMFSSLSIRQGYPVHIISNSTISGLFAPIWLEHPEIITLTFNVTGTNGSTGFCRVSIPTAMMNGTYHVSVNGTEIPYTLLPCSDANTSYLYFNYTHSTQEVIIIPEFPSFLILPSMFTATLLAVTVYRRKRR